MTTRLLWGWIALLLLAGCGGDAARTPEADAVQGRTATGEAVRTETPAAAPDLAGRYTFASKRSEADITLTRMAADRYRVQGESYYGIDRESGPNIGEIDMEVVGKGARYEGASADGAYRIVITPTSDGLEVSEEGECPDCGMNVTFAHRYIRKH